MARLCAIFLLAVLSVHAEDAPQPMYRVVPRVSTVELSAVPGVVRLDVPGRPRLAGVLAEEIVQVAPRAGRLMISSGGAGRLYRPQWKQGRSGQLWSGTVEGSWALSPDGEMLAEQGQGWVEVAKFLDARRVKRVRRMQTGGPVRMLFSRDSKRLMLVDGRLAMDTYGLEKPTPPAHARLTEDVGMLDCLYLFPDNRTLLFNVQGETGAGRLYCRDLRSGRTALADSYNAADWSSEYRATWDGRYLWCGSRLKKGGSEAVSDVVRFGVRGEDEAPLKLQSLMTWQGTTWRAGVANVGGAVAYGIGDHIEILDANAGLVLRVDGWPLHADEVGPCVVGFLEPQKMLVVQLGPSVYLLPVAYGT